MRVPIADNTVPLAVEGYGWLPNRRRRSGGGPVQTRLLGQRAIGLCGPQAARFFYDEDNVRRRTAIPEPVLGALFGHGAVQTLDGDAHRHRKAMFLSVLGPAGIVALVEQTTTAWDKAVASWSHAEPVVLFDEASRAITRGVWHWAGVSLADAEVAAVASDLVALVDGFASLGPRHWRTRRARSRLESRVTDLVVDVRAGRLTAPTDSALEAVAGHRDSDGELLDPKLAAVELLNVIRPTVAVCWFVAYAAHALHRWPQHREPLRAGDVAFAEAFTHEVRRFYPFAPFVVGRAVRDAWWQAARITTGSLILLDLYGQNHDPDLWQHPYTFDPQRFLGREIGPYELVPQGGGDPRTGHRCPGEQITVELLKALSVRLARLDYAVPPQDLSIPLRRMPARVASGFVLTPGG